MEPIETEEINVHGKGQIIEQVPGRDGSESRNGKGRLGADEERQ